MDINKIQKPKNSKIYQLRNSKKIKYLSFINNVKYIVKIKGVRLTDLISLLKIIMADKQSP